ncbi:hypothetical protein SAMN04487831_11327 [Pseudobutyrivibrio sp. UC1225]|uniref:hypothetical protein n=1 Tax=Pseudobutyrivibrio sp. UC1225 TaxID=1798185 RepID=UPI0008F1CABD|nr:hypothetical protein [Pseudobutyrivibrio sp. UC1225]SFO23073.1 hypothetical protein SAMN04487831_11327 [Pseudobutyrivibrio sp. UC1225]
MARSRSGFLNQEGPRVKFCTKCNCRIPVNSPYELCRDCMKKELFPKVKEFINENDDVNEMIVAQEFGIERSIVHEWVVEGHLEYKKRLDF